MVNPSALKDTDRSGIPFIRGEHLTLADLIKLRSSIIEWEALRADEEGENPWKVANTGTEFDSLKPWETGDDYRHIHHRASLRSIRPFVRTYSGSVPYPVNIILDLSPSMLFGSRHCTKASKGAQLATLATWIALSCGAQVRLRVFGTHSDSPISQGYGVISASEEFDSIHLLNDLSEELSMAIESYHLSGNLGTSFKSIDQLRQLIPLQSYGKTIFISDFFWLLDTAYQKVKLDHLKILTSLLQTGLDATVITVFDPLETPELLGANHDQIKHRSESDAYKTLTDTQSNSFDSIYDSKYSGINPLTTSVNTLLKSLNNGQWEVLKPAISQIHFDDMRFLR